MDKQLGGDCVFHGFERGADGLFAAEGGFADDLPADFVDEMVEDCLDIAMGEGNVQISEQELLGGISAVGVDGEFGHVILSPCAVIPWRD